MEQDKLTKESFQEILQKRTDYVEDIIKRYELKASPSSLLEEAMNYSLEAPGKRLRPIFLYETFRISGGTEPALVEPFLAAIEMIHSYSLVHDDLPAMDNDEYRRGRKTTHIVYGEDMAILAGDGLLNFAFETAMRSFDAVKTPEEQAFVIRALRILCQKPSVTGMIAGQAIDVAFERTYDRKTKRELLDDNNRPDSDASGTTKQQTINHIAQILSMYRMKTSALLSASMMMGAALTGADEHALSLLERIGEATGLAFQIRDDILDIESTTDELGKPVHSDERNEKTTLVSLIGLSRAKELTKEYSYEALSLLSEYCEYTKAEDTSFFSELIKSLIHRRK